MSTELAPLQQVQENIRERIKAEFANLIPDSMWQAMVASVVKDFTTDRKEYNTTKPSPLKVIIETELRELCKQHLKAELDRLSADQWPQGDRIASVALQKLVQESLPLIMASAQSMFAEFVCRNVVNELRNSMNRM